MRKCVRCKIAMVENCGIKVKGAAYGLVLTDDENKWWGGRMEQPKVASCPKCGEVSIYLENVEKLNYNYLTSLKAQFVGIQDVSDHASNKKL